MRRCGVSALIGSCDSSAMPEPRTAVQFALARSEQLAAANRTEPDARPFAASRPRHASSNCVLPDPDSPTTATHSPALHVERHAGDGTHRAAFRS